MTGQRALLLSGRRGVLCLIYKYVPGGNLRAIDDGETLTSLPLEPARPPLSDRPANCERAGLTAGTRMGKTQAPP